MLLKDVVGIERSLGVDHLLISDRFLLALTATLLAALLLRWLCSPRTDGSGLDVGNFPTLFQIRSHSASGLVIDLCSLGICRLLLLGSAFNSVSIIARRCSGLRWRRWMLAL